jgi:hypothetical protein
MALIELIEKGADSDLVREMLAFAAEQMMEAEVEARTGAAHGARDPLARSNATAIANGPGIRGRAGSTWRSRACARAATFRASWSPGALPRKR